MITPLPQNPVVEASQLVFAYAIRAIGWPARVFAARQAMRELAGLTEHELRDIGLTRQDLLNASALPLDIDPTPGLARARSQRASSTMRKFGRAA